LSVLIADNKQINTDDQSNATLAVIGFIGKCGAMVLEVAVQFASKANEKNVTPTCILPRMYEIKYVQ